MWLPVLFPGAQKTAVAVALIKGDGKGLMKVNGCPIELLEPEILRVKVFEPLLLLGQERFAGVDMRIRVRGGGYTSQIYAIRQAIAKGIVAYYQKCTCACLWASRTSDYLRRSGSGGRAGCGVRSGYSGTAPGTRAVTG